MRIGDYVEAVQYIRETSGDAPDADFFEERIDSGVQLTWQEGVDFVHFSKLLATELFGKCTVIAIWERGIWPHSENLFLIDTVSNIFGGKAITTHSSFAIFFEDDCYNEFRTMLQIFLQSGWGGFVYTDSMNWFVFDHDGFGCLQLRNSEADILKHYRVLSRSG